MKIFKVLLLSLFAGNVFLKLFTNKLNLLPRVLNIWDVIIIAVLLLLFISRMGEIRQFRYKNVLIAILGFNIILLTGASLNLDYIFPKAALAQVIMLNEPIILFLIIVNLPFKLPDLIYLIYFFYIVILVQFGIGVLQIPLYFTSGDTESIMGTFYHNPEQYSLFMLFGIFFVFGKYSTKTLPAKKAFPLIIIMLMLNIMVDNKASWPFIALAMYFTLDQMGASGRSITQRIQYIFVAALLTITGYYIIQTFSPTVNKYNRVTNSLDKESNFLQFRKINAYMDAILAFQKYPHMWFFGSGPGTFYSRSSYQFYDVYNRVGGTRNRGEYRTSDSMAGVISRYEKEPFFYQFDKNREYTFIGSTQLDDPFSANVAIFGETGIIGSTIYFYIYLTILLTNLKLLRIYRRNKTIFPVLITACGITFYMFTASVYYPWLEMGRITTILWGIIAIGIKYDEVFKNYREHFMKRLIHQQTVTTKNSQSISVNG